MYRLQTRKPRIPILNIAYTIPRYPNTGLPEKADTIWLTIPKPGIIRIYTSGWPKNQNRCW